MTFEEWFDDQSWLVGHPFPAGDTCGPECVSTAIATAVGFEEWLALDWPGASDDVSDMRAAWNAGRAAEATQQSEREAKLIADTLEPLIEEFENLTILGSDEKRLGYETAMRTAVTSLRAAVQEGK